MLRREFITLFGGMVATWPLTAGAQQAEKPIRIGFLPIGSQSDTYDQSLVEALRRGLREVGLVESERVTLDVVWASGATELSRALGDMAQRGAKLLVTAGSSASAAAKQYTSQFRSSLSRSAILSVSVLLKACRDQAPTPPALAMCLPT